MSDDMSIVKVDLGKAPEAWINRETKRQEDAARPGQIIAISAAEDTAAIARAYRDNRVDMIRTIGQIHKTKLELLAKEDEQDILGKRRRSREIDELRHYANLRDVFLVAKELLEHNGTDPLRIAGIDDDWWARAKPCIENTGEKRMQELWAKALVREIEAPGAISLATIQLINSINKQQADLIAEYFRYVAFVYDNDIKVWSHNIIGLIGNDRIPSATIGTRDFILFRDLGISNDNITMLARGRTEYDVHYFDAAYKVDDSGSSSLIDHTSLTLVGEQLYSLCELQPIEGLTEHMKHRLHECGYNLTPIKPIAPNSILSNPR